MKKVRQIRRQISNKNTKFHEISNCKMILCDMVAVVKENNAHQTGYRENQSQRNKRSEQ